MKRARTRTVELPAASPEEPGEGTSLVDAILAEHAARAGTRGAEAREARKRERRAKPAGEPPRIDGMVIGTILGVDGPGEATVELPAGIRGARGKRRARSAVRLAARDAGREAALMFDGGDPKKPVIVGLLQPKGTFDEATVDGERVELTAQKEIVLRCGKASITLTRAGKVLIRGAYVSSRSTGANRIKGGSVDIN